MEFENDGWVEVLETIFSKHLSISLKGFHAIKQQTPAFRLLQNSYGCWKIHHLMKHQPPRKSLKTQKQIKNKTTTGFFFPRPHKLDV